MSNSTSSSDNQIDQTATTTLPGATEAEQRLREQFAGLNLQQIRALQSGLERLSSTDSPLTLNLQDQQALDQQYQAAHNRFQMGLKDFADFSAGGRGLRLSDTPISQQSFDRAGLGLADLQGQWAKAGLDMGLATNQYRTNTALGLGGALPGAGAFSLGNYLQERMAQPTTHTVGTGYASGSQTPSGLSTGAQVAGGVGSLAMGAAAAFAI
ncbi:MAG: hypothetical protein ABT940_00595 [Alphaproteobacteria bacterium]